MSRNGEKRKTIKKAVKIEAKTEMVKKGIKITM